MNTLVFRKSTLAGFKKRNPRKRREKVYQSENTNAEKAEPDHREVTPSSPADGYENIEKLKLLIHKGKYRLDCGHHVTLNHNLGNNIAILNGNELKIICTLCLY